jgi:hypothetical protein
MNTQSGFGALTRLMQITTERYMKTFSKAEIRGAILSTAKLFEEKPDLWNWSNTQVPDCGTPGCALGYIGTALEIPAGKAVVWVEEVLGYKDIFSVQSKFYADMNDASRDYGWNLSASGASKALRAYADKYFPEVARPIIPESHQIVKWESVVWRPAALRESA